MSDHLEASVLGHVEEVPEGWLSIRLDQLIEPSKEKVDPRKLAPDTPYLSLEHIESGTGEILDRGIAADVRSAKSVFAAGDVLFGRLRPYLNKVAVPDFAGVCSTDILVFADDSVVDPLYLRWFLSQATVIKYASHYATGDLPRIKFDRLGEIDFLLPPRAEQKRIVRRAKELFERSAAARDRIARGLQLIRQARSSVLEAGARGRLTERWREENQEIPSAESLIAAIRARREKRTRKSQPEPASPPQDLAELPESWRWSRVSDVATVKLGGTPSRKENSFWGGKVTWVSSGEVANCRISDTNEQITQAGLDGSSAKLYPSGSVLIAMIGDGKTRGQSAILDIQAATNQNVAGLVFEDGGMNPEFVWRWALSQYAQTRAGGRGGAQAALNKQKVGELWIPVPPSEEQEEIVRRVDELLGRTDQVSARISASARLSDRTTQEVLRKAFRGQLVPTEAELAAAEGRPYESAEELLRRTES